MGNILSTRCVTVKLFVDISGCYYKGKYTFAYDNSDDLTYGDIKINIIRLPTFRLSKLLTSSEPSRPPLEVYYDFKLQENHFDQIMLQTEDYPSCLLNDESFVPEGQSRIHATAKIVDDNVANFFKQRIDDYKGFDFCTVNTIFRIPYLRYV